MGSIGCQSGHDVPFYAGRKGALLVIGRRNLISTHSPNLYSSPIESETLLISAIDAAFHRCLVLLFYLLPDGPQEGHDPPRHLHAEHNERVSARSGQPHAPIPPISRSIWMLELSWLDCLSTGNF
jgi:hypothetical protein